MVRILIPVQGAVLILFFAHIKGQPTFLSNNYGDVCLKTCPEVLEKLIQMEETVTTLKSEVTELNDWKAKHGNGHGQENPDNPLTTNQPQITNPPLITDQTLYTIPPEITEQPQTTNFPLEGYKVYFIGFLKSIFAEGHNSLLISSEKPTTVHVYSKQPAYDTKYIIGAKGSVRIDDISKYARVSKHNTVTQQGILVNATEDVWVQGGNVIPGSLDGFNVIHAGDDSTEFLIVSFRSKLAHLSGFVVVGTQDNTTVDIFKPVTGGGRVHVTQININKLDTYAWYAPSYQEVTGFKVISDKPIAVFAGHECLTRVFFCDHLVSSLPPTARLGNTYIVPPVAGLPRSLGYLLKVVANENNTEVTIYRGTEPYTVSLNENQFYSRTITRSDEPLVVKCTKPCLVAKSSFQNLNRRTDVYMMIITPTSALSQNVRFGTLDTTHATFDATLQNLYLIVISVYQETTSYRLNDNPIQTPWSQVPGLNSYVYTILRIQRGFYHLTTTSTTGRFAAYVQGFNGTHFDNEGIGYRIGLF